ncbi:hypothetical protein [Marinilabilia rubra]|nr:hypothetical protein [Marinilabilia rubra]
MIAEKWCGDWSDFHAGVRWSQMGITIEKTGNATWYMLWGMASSC